MRQPYSNASALFCEEVSTVTSLFDKWNDCERSVVMCALLKRLSFPTLKFLQTSIEANLVQNFVSKNDFIPIEVNANCTEFLDRLIDLYKSCPTVKISQMDCKDSMLCESELYLNTDSNKSYHCKEDILLDILNMIPLLRPGEEDAKQRYISLMPMAVDDTVQQIVAPEYVQQIFSYLLIHPAISNADRRSLSHLLRHLEDHIQSTVVPGQGSFYILANPQDTQLHNLYEPISSTNAPANPWQAIAPPTHKQQVKKHVTSQNLPHQTNLILSSHNSASSTSSSDWNLDISQLTSSSDFNNLTTSQNGLGLVKIDPNEGDNTIEDSHISFSKNGTEVFDFDDNSFESDKECNGNIVHIDKKLNVVSFKTFADPMLVIKTRRSNSLTSASTNLNQTQTTTAEGVNFNSTENLTNSIPKQRSYSLSIDSSHSSLPSSISETRLDELKYGYMKMNAYDVAMANIGQWLKSLRLHKYAGIFSNMNYEDMLNISEDYLQKMGVTKGASHKLALCIEKLRNRFSNLSKMQMNLIEKKVSLNSVMENLASIVLTPMKPTDCIGNDNVASKFLEVLDLVCRIIIKKEISVAYNEECVNGILWVLERTLHSHTFVAHANILKAYKFQLSKIKMQLEPRGHCTKNNVINCIPNKSRWNNTKIRKTDEISKSGSADRINRKSSNDGAECSSTLAQSTRCIMSNNSQHRISQQAENYFSFQKSHHVHNNIFIRGPSAKSTSYSQYKSASYPNFSICAGSTGKPLHKTQVQATLKPKQYSQHHNHRHSFNNLIILSKSNHRQHEGVMPDVEQLECPTNFSEIGKRNSIQISSLNLLNEKSTPCQNENYSKKVYNKHIKSNIGEINSSLEFLCLQMTEHAIN